jgi:hypothetical protein
MAGVLLEVGGTWSRSLADFDGVGRSPRLFHKDDPPGSVRTGRHPLSPLSVRTGPASPFSYQHTPRRRMDPLAATPSLPPMHLCDVSDRIDQATT